MTPDDLRNLSDQLSVAAQKLRDERPYNKEAWDAIAAMEHASRWAWSAAASLQYHRMTEPPF